MKGGAFRSSSSDSTGSDGEELAERRADPSSVEWHRRSEVIHHAATCALRRLRLASERPRAKTTKRIQLQQH